MHNQEVVGVSDSPVNTILGMMIIIGAIAFLFWPDTKPDVMTDQKLATTCKTHHRMKGVDIGMIGGWKVTMSHGQALVVVKTKTQGYRRCMMTDSGTITESN